MVKTLKYDNPDSEIDFEKSKSKVKYWAKLMTQAMNDGTSAANLCNHQVLLIK